MIIHKNPPTLVLLFGSLFCLIETTRINSEPSGEKNTFIDDQAPLSSPTKKQKLPGTEQSGSEKTNGPPLAKDTEIINQNNHGQPSQLERIKYIKINTYLAKIIEINTEKHSVIIETPINKQHVKATFIVVEDAKIRTLIIPTLFDDRGNITKPTKKELLALKGKDRLLPGYESDFSSLKPNQTIKIQQVTTKEHELVEKQKINLEKINKKKQMPEYLSNYIEINSEPSNLPGP